ncbi:MAG: M1 family metallopeptidase [Flavobacteriales bacterium]
MKRLFSILLCLGISFSGYSQSYWQQEAHYQMDINFDSENHQFDGLQELTFINHSPDTLTKVFYHLYFNAFQPGSMMDVRSRTILDPDRRVGDRISHLKENEIGSQQITSLKLNETELNFVHDRTILEVFLENEILPGDTAVFSMEFKTQVPIQIRRSGRMNKEGIDYSMSQWYPKMCEYDTDGWHTNPYVGREFYGIWGSFDVNITMDAAYTIAATGVLQNADEIGHGYSTLAQEAKSDRLTWNFKAENVHDFVWAADPDYTHDIVVNDNGPDFHLFYLKGEKTKEWEFLGDYMIKTFAYADENFGKYPYPHYSIIQGGDGGMEYPMATLITGNRKLKSLVGVCVHEAMHSWYQGMLATNESLFSWMDEGFTSYASNRIEQQLFPEDWKDVHGSSYKGYKRIANSKYEEPLCTHADHFNTNWAYGTASYSKGVVILDQLSHIVGQDVVDSSLLRYFKEWSFKHPTASDFKRIVERESGIELDWYFDYFVNTTKTIDYAIEEVAKTENGTNVVLKKGEMPMPIELEVQLKDGTKLNYYIPTVLMRGEKALDTEIVQLRDWAWTNPYYVISIKNEVQDIEAITLHPNNKSIADIERLNDRLLMPEKWNWDKYNLMLNIVSRNKKGKRQKLKKIKK